MIDIINYDKNNIFAKILEGQIPSKKIFENEYVFAFEDINPQAPIHVLIIPKKPFCSFDDFLKKANQELICRVQLRHLQRPGKHKCGFQAPNYNAFAPIYNAFAPIYNVFALILPYAYMGASTHN